MNWLLWSVVASVVLTLLLNGAIRLFPGAADRATRRMEEMAAPRDDSGGEPGGMRVIVPWKAMIIGSLLLTVLLNVAIRVF